MIQIQVHTYYMSYTLLSQCISCISFVLLMRMFSITQNHEKEIIQYKLSLPNITQ